LTLLIYFSVVSVTKNRKYLLCGNPGLSGFVKIFKLKSEKVKNRLYEKLLKIVTNLNSPRVLLAGDFMLDVYTYGDAERISPEAPVPILKVTRTEYRCGGASAVAADLAKLGAKVFCIGVIGSDANGQILKDKLADAGIDTSAVIAVNDRPTITKQRLIGLAQHRHQQQLFRIDQEITDPLPDAQNKKILRHYKERLPEIDIVCLQDYNKGLLSSAVCTEMIRLAKQAGKKVLIDPSPRADYSKYTSATLITPNRTEASIAVGFDLKTPDIYPKAADALAKKLQLDAVVITLDKEGAYLKTENISELVPTHPRNVYDVTGAGDMVLAALAVTLAAGCDYKSAVQLANIAGGIEVEKFGIATVSVEEIINEIIGQNRGKSGKIRTIDSLLPELNWHRSQSGKIVFTNGCFDVLHIGHVEYLKFCKNAGSVLVVGLNSDASVKIIKGPARPINNQFDRAAVLAAMEAVDYIVIFDEPDPFNLIKQVKPDILIKGQDWEKKGIIGADFVSQYSGKILFAPLVEGKSSTKIIEKVKSL
jgi:D-beta-D-heptose 7-phosphate kinase / D-beta-D-heptose 1-phosphate adenosyltransferase